MITLILFTACLLRYCRYPSESLGIIQPLGKGLGSVQMVEDPCMFAEWHQGIAQVKPHVDGLL